MEHFKSSSLLSKKELWADSLLFKNTVAQRKVKRV